VLLASGTLQTETECPDESEISAIITGEPKLADTVFAFTTWGTIARANVKISPKEMRFTQFCITPGCDFDFNLCFLFLVVALNFISTAVYLQFMSIAD
jgi:hypothetical protein